MRIAAVGSALPEHFYDQETLLAAFREARAQVVRRLEAVPDDALTLTADHPRLSQPMTLVDLFFFVAEHDDHHMAAITGLLEWRLP